tara:strand:+ start:10076 stop:10396 length:321 start_codon:yes stop_codon:yes gene_type:complete
MSFKYDKDNLYIEFNQAKAKDIKLSKKKTLEEKEDDIYKNRIEFFKGHIETKKSNPKVYEDVDINFENLLHAYTQPNPRDYFYMKVFKKPYAEVIKDSKPQSMRDY